MIYPVMYMYSNNLICDILEYIDTFLNTKISVNELEKKFFYNRYYIMKLFKKEIGVTLFSYINKLKVYNSLSDLNNTNTLLIRIALNNGFYSLEYFSEIFKKEIGISPQKYRKIINNKYLRDDEFIDVTNNIINIKNIIDYCNKYKRNRKKVALPVRKISLFN